MSVIARLVRPCLFTLALAPAAALAESEPAAPPATPAPDPAPELRYAPVTHHTFTGEEVDGRTRDPDGQWVEGRAGAAPGSLIRIRTTFRAELLQSAADI